MKEPIQMAQVIRCGRCGALYAAAILPVIDDPEWSRALYDARMKRDKISEIPASEAKLKSCSCPPAPKAQGVLF